VRSGDFTLGARAMRCRDGLEAARDLSVKPRLHDPQSGFHAGMPCAAAGAGAGGALRPHLPAPSRRAFALALALALAAVLLALAAQRADAVILPAHTIDGPNQNIVGFGGIAMAEDGTGGLVYLKRVEGVPHVFVSRYIGGHWLAPIRVDAGEQFAASWPRIGAAEGGELVVVWATPFATENERPVDELLGATLGPGATAFGPAVLIDPNIEDGTGTSPDLAMSSTGRADVVYRVVRTNGGSVPLLRPGDVDEEVRVAHYDDNRWSRLGEINRNPEVSMRPPTAANAPQIAIGAGGNGVVVWQEPEIEGVARIWARRLFGGTLDYVLPVSTASFNGAPLGADADAPSVAVSVLGQAEVAYRQGIGAGSPLPGPRVFLNILPDGESAEGTEFQGAILADSEVAGGAAATVGQPSIDIDSQHDMRLLYDSNGTPRVIGGNDSGLTGGITLGPAYAGNEPSSASVMNPEGGGVSAWTSTDPYGHPAVAVREDFPEGGAQTALVRGGAGGPVAELSVGRSGLGDGLVGFRQGPIGDAAIVASDVSAPPDQFVTNIPKGWIKPPGAAISWLPALSANGPLTYQVVLDGRVVDAPRSSLELHLDSRGLGDGKHQVQVLATDAFGQEQLTPPTTLEIDGQLPTVAFGRAQGGWTVTIRVRDSESGVDASAVSVSFGDGQGARGHTRYRHTYSHAGVYQIVVHVRDKLGNMGNVRRLVNVP